MLERSFQDLIVARMKHLENWEEWNLIAEKVKLLTLREPLMSLIGKFRMERIQRVMKNLYSIHSELMEHQCCKLRVRLWIKNLQASRILKWESDVENQTGEQYFQQGRI